MNQIKQVFTTPDGSVFDTKEDALNHIRLPKIREALGVLTDGNEDLVSFLVENQEGVLSALDSGTIRRVTKQEKKKLLNVFNLIEEERIKGTEYLFEEMILDGRSYVLRDILIDSWKWPKVSRMDDEEKRERMAESLSKLGDLTPEVIDWIIQKKEDISEAYDAGKEKREVSPKALAGLEEYRRRKAEEKAAREAE
jgi:hypothetical protein